MRYSLPGQSNTSEIILSSVVTPVANEISVGGTWIFSKVPLMLSLPPIAPVLSPSCASIAPRSAASGSPQRSGSEPNRLKYSCNDSLIVSRFTPAATSFATDDSTECTAPINGECLISRG